MPDDPDTQSVLEAFVDAHLLLESGDKETGKSYYELTHEALIEHWSMFQDWLKSEEEDDRYRQQLEGEASRWLDSDAAGNEQPRHQVTIEAFNMGKYEVTFEEYEVFANSTNRDLDDEGWGRGSQRDDKQTAPVGSFKANAFSVYDTAGNVYEWVRDCWHDSYEGSPDDGLAWEEAEGGNCDRRVIRGGSWVNTPRLLRSAYRFRLSPDTRDDFLGFRLAQDVE